jgi:hypothetical protein
VPIRLQSAIVDSRAGAGGQGAMVPQVGPIWQVSRVSGRADRRSASRCRRQASTLGDLPGRPGRSHAQVRICCPPLCGHFLTFPDRLWVRGTLLVAELTNGSDTPGTPLQLWAASTGQHQVWKFQEGVLHSVNSCGPIAHFSS